VSYHPSEAFTAATALEAVTMATKSLTTSDSNRSVSSAPDLATSHADAPQPFAERGELNSNSLVEAAGAAKFNRRAAMNMIMGTVAMTVSAQPVHANKIRSTAALADLIETFNNANRALRSAIEIADNIDESRFPSVRIHGGTTEPMTLVINGDTKTIPASDWFFHSGDQIRDDLKKSLNNAPATEHEAIKKRYDGYWLEYTKQHQANKKATATKRKAEAAVAKAYRIEGRALRAILEYEPSSASEAVLLLEFAVSEEAFGDSDDLRTIIENASHALRMTISA
jgi:hypothetical protein